MSIIRPPYTGDPLIDSWTNQITQAINMGLMLPGVQGQSGGEGSSGTAGNTTLYLYQRTAANVAPSRPTSVSYDYTDINNVTITANNSWLGEVPTSGGGYLWITFRYVSSLVDTITDSTTWNTPVLLAVDGDDGVNSATPQLHKKYTSATLPSGELFSGTFTYTFATGLLSGGSINGWSQTAPALIEGDFLFTSQAFAQAAATTVDLTTAAFTTPQVSSIAGTDGTPGTDGTNANIIKNVYLYNSSASAPTAPATADGFNTTTGAAEDTTAGAAPNTVSWTVAVPSIGAGEVLWLVSGNVTQTEGTGNFSNSGWTVTQASGYDGATGGPGPTGPPAPRFITRRLYASSSTGTPGSPSATLTWATLALSGITAGSPTASWSETAPTAIANSSILVYFSDLLFSDTTGSASTSAATGTSPTEGIGFSGLVSFNSGSGAFILNGTGAITTIDGGNIATDTITLNKLNSVAFSSGASGNIGIGEGVLDGTLTSSTDNIGLGYNVMTGTLTNSNNNVGIGYSAIQSLSSGDNNVALGTEAGTLASFTSAWNKVSLTTGTGNVLLGRSTQVTANNTSYAVGIGIQATVGDYATAVGSVSYAEGTSFDNNSVAVGNGTIARALNGDGLSATEGGSGDVVIGTNAGGGDSSFNTSGTLGIGGDGVAIGYNSLGRFGGTTTGRGMTAVGYETGYGITGSVVAGTFVGYRSGFGVTTGSSNTIIGSQANVQAGANDKVVVVGADSSATADSVSVGYESDATGDYSISVGAEATASGAGSIAIGSTGSTTTPTTSSGEGSIAIGHDATATGDNSIAIGTVDAAANEIVIGKSTQTSVNVGAYDLSTLGGGSNPWYAIGVDDEVGGGQGNFTIEGSQAFSSGAGDYEIVMVGGGGGGREGEPNSGNQSSSGGGAGGCAKFTLAWDGSAAINVSLGDGGQSSTSPNVFNNGGNSQLWLGSITAANLVVTANGGGRGWKATNSYNGEIVSGGAGGTVVFNSTLPTGISNTRGFQGGNGGAADFTLSGGNFVACMACGGGGAVNFLELTDYYGVSNGGQTSGGRARVSFLNGTAAGAGGSIFGPPPTVTASAQASITTVSTSRGDVHNGNARSRTNAAAGGAGDVFETVGGNDVGGPFFDNVPVGRSFAVIQSSASTNVNQSNIVIPDVNVGVMGGGGFAKNSSTSETTSHLYQAQNGFLFGGGGGAACGNQNQSTLPRGGRGGYGGGGGAGGSNSNRGTDKPGYGGDGLILIRKL